MPKDRESSLDRIKKKLRRLERKLNKDDIGLDVMLDAETIKRVYVNFGMYVDEINAAAVFAEWLNVIPEHALRLRLCLDQVAGSGLTAFLINGRALRRYNDFPWDRLNTLIGQELNNFTTAIAAVGGNPYYGFKRDLGAAKSTKFSSLAYVAKELLIRLGAEQTLKNYQGWIKRPKSPAAVEAMIIAYCEAKEQDLIAVGQQPADPIALQAILNVVNDEQNANLFA